MFGPAMQLFRALRPSCFVWLLAAMASFGQIVGAAAMPERADELSLGVICGVDSTGPHHVPAPHQHHDCAACPLCAAAAIHAVLPATGPLLPEPTCAAASKPGLPPPARAPPLWRFEQPFPRGPPAFA